MLNIFTMDSDRWITEGLRLYFSGQMISCLTLTSPDDPITLLRWLAGPRRMTEIGHALHLSNKTISHYKNTISRKLGCKNHMDFYHRLTSYGF